MCSDTTYEIRIIPKALLVVQLYIRANWMHGVFHTTQVSQVNTSQVPNYPSHTAMSTREGNPAVLRPDQETRTRSCI